MAKVTLRRHQSGDTTSPGQTTPAPSKAIIPSQKPVQRGTNEPVQPVVEKPVNEEPLVEPTAVDEAAQAVVIETVIEPAQTEVPQAAVAPTLPEATEPTRQEMQERYEQLQEAAASALSIARDRLTTVLNTTQTGLCLLDDNHEIVEINSAGAAFLRTTREAAVGRSITELLWPPNSRPRDTAPIELKRSIEQHKEWERDLVRIRISADETATCSIAYTPLGEPDQASNGGLLAFHDLTAQHRAAEDMAWRATHDPLTGLLNRAAFTHHIDSALGMVRDSQLSCAVLFIDLDQFKNINDTSGHDVGDTVLVEAASRIRNSVRANDVVARLGGDEFVVYLEDVPGTHAVNQVAERILNHLRRPFQVVGQLMHLSASIGYALAGPEYETASSLLRDADIALYRAKAAGRDQAVAFGEDLREVVQLRVELDRQLRRAVANHELTVAFQPMFDLNTERIVGFETLARWPTADGFISPAEFIPLAEENGLINQIGEQVLKEAVSLAAAIGAGQTDWPEQGLVVAVNVSGVQLTRPGFADVVRRTLRSASVPAHALTLELTESSLISHRDTALRELRILRQMGVNIALDDFGTGWSSLSLLQLFPINCIKIDQTFVARMTSSTDDQAIVAAVVGLGKTLNHIVIAEGVELVEQAEALAEIGCEIVQGYLYGPPTTRADAVRAARLNS